VKKPAIFAVAAFTVLFFTVFTSCNSAKQLAYFKNLPDSTVVHLPLIPLVIRWLILMV